MRVVHQLRGAQCGLPAGDATLRGAIVDSPEFASLARAWDIRFRAHFHRELKQPASAHQVSKRTLCLEHMGSNDTLKHH